MILMPEWFSYIVWGKDENGNVVPLGLRKDTPKDIQMKYKQDVLDLEQLQGEYPNDRII